MVRHMRNIRRISIRNMVSVVETLLLILESVALGELDELFTIEFILEIYLSPLL
jgi:hypothetical protein